jgi:putative NADH-flavin reductase
MKQVTVYGATGNIGSRIVRLLLKKGYRVVAFVHGEHTFTESPKLIVYKGDIYNKQDVAEAMHGSRAIISALGSWGTPQKDVLSAGMSAIIPAMKKQKIARIITLTGSDARVPEDKPSVLHKVTHAFFGAAAPKIMRDGEQHMRMLYKSGLQWTTLRSPVMNETGEKGAYTLRMKLPGIFATIHRDDVAEAMVWLLETGDFVHKAPVIYRK